MIGILSWGIAIIISVSIFIIIKNLVYKIAIKNTNIKLIISIIISAIIADIIIHFIISVETSFAEMMMWASISFPFVGICLVFINLVINALYEWKVKGKY
jgi:hypothetical protein